MSAANGTDGGGAGERLAKLEERVFVTHTNEIGTLKAELKEANRKLIWIIVFAAANFGTGILELLKP